MWTIVRQQRRYLVLDEHDPGSQCRTQLIRGRGGVYEAGEHLALASRVFMDGDPVAPLGQSGDWIPVHPGNSLAGDDDVSGHELQGLPWQEAFNRIRRSIRRWDAVRRVRVHSFCQDAGIVRLS